MYLINKNLLEIFHVKIYQFLENRYIIHRLKFALTHDKSQFENLSISVLKSPSLHGGLAYVLRN